MTIMIMPVESGIPFLFVVLPVDLQYFSHYQNDCCLIHISILIIYFIPNPHRSFIYVTFNKMLFGLVDFQLFPQVHDSNVYIYTSPDAPFYNSISSVFRHSRKI